LIFASLYLSPLPTARAHGFINPVLYPAIKQKQVHKQSSLPSQIHRFSITHQFRIAPTRPP
jgi:hypothetical protein